MKLILASASPRRLEILQNIRVPCTVVPSGADENIDPSLPPHLIVQELAMLKAADVAKSTKGRALVLGCDTLVYLDDMVLGKPKDAQDARQMLQKLSGRTHLVYSGICVINTATSKTTATYCETEVVFDTLSNDTIANYVQTGEPLDKAGAYGIQGLGALLVKRINGDYLNVVGLPLFALQKLLQTDFDIDLLTGLIDDKNKGGNNI